MADKANKDKDVVVEKKNTKTPVWVWIILGVLLISLCCCSTLFFGLLAFDGGSSLSREEFYKKDETEETIEKFQQPESSYVCVADIVGIPVEKAGSCSWCTINYLYDETGENPGDVYIVFAEPMQYSEGAYVYQYPSGDGFWGCIQGQDFYTDPGYNPVPIH